MWTRFNVRWEFMTSLCASTPSDPDVQKAWIEARKPKVRPPSGKSIDEIAAEVAESTLETDNDEEKLLVFQRPPHLKGGLAMRIDTVRAHVKDCATVLSSLYTAKVEREKSFAVKVKNGVYWPVEHYWVPVLDRNDQPVTKPTGTKQVLVHSMTRQGPISAIKVYEYVDDAVMAFPLLVLTQPGGKLVVSETDLKTLFMYGGTHGYAGERSRDGGRYVFGITQAGDE